MRYLHYAPGPGIETTHAVLPELPLFPPVYLEDVVAITGPYELVIAIPQD